MRDPLDIARAVNLGNQQAVEPRPDNRGKVGESQAGIERVGTDEELSTARRIVEAFAAQPDAGTLGIDGKMYDIPHLKAAQRTLATIDDARTP